EGRGGGEERREESRGVERRGEVGRGGGEKRREEGKGEGRRGEERAWQAGGGGGEKRREEGRGEERRGEERWGEVEETAETGGKDDSPRPGICTFSWQQRERRGNEIGKAHRR